MNDTTRLLQDDRQRLAGDLRTVVNDAEALLRHAADGAGQGFQDARGRLEHSLGKAKTELVAFEQGLADRVANAGAAADRYVHRHPWGAIGAGATLGLVLGLVLGRR